MPSCASRINYQCACAYTTKTMVRSQDYHAHISKVQRTPSILTDVPQYPNAHLAFNNKKVVYEEDNGVEVVHVQNQDVETNQCYPMKNKGGFEKQKWKPLGLDKLVAMNLDSLQAIKYYKISNMCD